MRIVIPGGSGQIGQSLARHFHARGHKVTTIARRVEPRDWRTLAWNAIDSGPWTEALEGSDLVINLAGRSVNCRYSPDNRREILDSRIQTTRLIGQTIALLNNPPGVWMNASTATIYRHALDRAMDETTGELGGSEPGAPSTWRFSIEVARSWEQALSEARIIAQLFLSCYAPGWTYGQSMARGTEACPAG
ncbi:MAG: NAD-dependent epimerase/dehydratase family protein [Bryobacteraceae bacterium]|nr:NAD-dependent epimerase/dehydratase family protein [Bryobacteraceae bacterium]